MSTLNCPQCQASLSLRDWPRNRYWTCPFCGLDGVSLPKSAAPGDVDIDDTAEADCAPWDRDAPEVRPLPRGSGLQVIAAEAEQLVVLLPPERLPDRSLWFPILSFVAAAGSLCFAWQAMLQGGSRLLLLVTGMMWLAIWAKGRKILQWTDRQTLLSIAPDRIVLQSTIAFVRESCELAVDPQTVCEPYLKEVAARPSQPAVTIRNSDGMLVLGMHLSGAEQRWLIREIRDRLRSDPLSLTAEMTLARADTAPDLHGIDDHFSPLPASALPTNSPVRILEQGAEGFRLDFAMRDIQNRQYRPDLLALSGLCVLVVILGVGGVIVAVREAPETALLSLLLLLGLPFVLALLKWIVFQFLGRVTLRLTAEELVCTWSVGPLRRRSVLPLRDIRAMLVGAAECDLVPRYASCMEDRIPGFRLTGGILIVTHNRTVRVNSSAELEIATQIAGLVKGQVESWGLSLPAYWVAVPSTAAGVDA